MRRLFRWPSKSGPLVLQSQASGVQVEGVDYLMGANLDRVALIAHWAPSPVVSRSVSELTRCLVAGGYKVAIVSTVESTDALEWPEALPSGVTVLRRPNVGYDFGSWATALDRYPATGSADEVLLLNDSLAGPFECIDNLLGRFHESGADVWGMTDTTQFGHHLQSYCLGFKNQTLREAPLAKFWRGIRVEACRDDVIWGYEIGLSRMLRREHYTVDAGIRYQRACRDGQNPTILGWRRLLDLGFPFIKRQLLRNPELAPDGNLIRLEISRRYGVDVDAWV